MNEDWVKIYDSQESLKINVAKARLNDHGIESVVMDKKDSAYVVIGRSELYVPKDKAEEAVKILEAELKE